MHVLFKNVPHLIQNLHLMHFVFYHYIYVKPDPRISYKPHSCAITWSQQAHLSMSYLALLLLLFLCVSSHACTAGPLSLTIKGTAKYHFDEELDKVKLLKTITASKLKEINVCRSSGSTSTLKEMIVGASGTSFQTDSPSFLATKEQRRHARSMLGPAGHHVEETVVANASDTIEEEEEEEDKVEMDYAQPHRKPPIHNEMP